MMHEQRYLSIEACDVRVHKQMQMMDKCACIAVYEVVVVYAQSLSIIGLGRAAQRSMCELFTCVACISYTLPVRLFTGLMIS